MTARCVQVGSHGCDEPYASSLTVYRMATCLQNSYDEGRKFVGRSVHAPELWTVCWNVGRGFGVVCSFYWMRSAVCR